MGVQGIPFVTAVVAGQMLPVLNGAALPRTFRFLTRGLGTRETRSNDLLSLVMFQPDYLSALIDLGEKDAMARIGEIETFLQPIVSPPVQVDGEKSQASH